MPRNTNAKHPSNAARQAAFREKRQAKATAVEKLVASIVQGLDRSNAWRFSKGMPEETNARIEWLTAKFNESKLCAFPFAEEEEEKRRPNRCPACGKFVSNMETGE